MCGGSIFDKDTIITSAQCCQLLNDGKDYKIVAGELNTHIESGDEQIRRIKRHIIHPDFDADSLKNDICKLTLNSSLNIVKGQVEGIPLDETDIEDLDGIICQVTGWGALTVCMYNIQSKVSIS